MTKFFVLLSAVEGDYCWQEGEEAPEISNSQFRGEWDGKAASVKTISGTIPANKGIPFLGWPQTAE